MPRSDKTQIENFIHELENEIESLKTQYNLFFSGELNVPPEKLRDDIEKKVRKLTFTEQKTAKVKLLVQNLASRFNLYNNMWLKKLHDIEVGVVRVQKKGSARTGDMPRGAKPSSAEITISLNSEKSFEDFYTRYCKMLSRDEGNESSKDQIINSLKAKMISSNLIDAKIHLVLKEGKVNVKFKN